MAPPYPHALEQNPITRMLPSRFGVTVNEGAAPLAATMPAALLPTESRHAISPSIAPAKASRALRITAALVVM